MTRRRVQAHACCLASLPRQSGSEKVPMFFLEGTLVYMEDKIVFKEEQLVSSKEAFGFSKNDLCFSDKCCMFLKSLVFSKGKSCVCQRSRVLLLQ